MSNDPMDELAGIYDENAQQMREAVVKYRRKQASRLGGLAVSRDHAHMVEIGRKGGQKVSADRAHMSEIGRCGGARARVAKESNDGQEQNHGASGQGDGSGSEQG